MKRTPDQATLRLDAAIRQVIEQQLEADEPAAVRQTLTRLLAEGLGEEEARRLIGQVVAREVLGVLTEGRPYDEARYVAALERLPRLP